MPQDVRRDPVREARRPDGRRERLAHRTDRLAVPLDDRPLGDAEPFPAAQVRKQPIGEANGRLAFLGLTCAIRAAIEYASLKIDMSASDRRHERRAANRPVPGPGVQPDQDEAREVPADRALGPLVAHDLARPPCRSD